MFISAKFYTTNEIKSAWTCESFIQILENKGLIIEKIHEFEPIRTPYTKEKAIEMWTAESPGCYVDGRGCIGLAGGMMGRGKKPSFMFDTFWWENPEKVMVNQIILYIPGKSVKKNVMNLNDVFIEVSQLVDSFYGYISHEIPEDRQHVTGTIETRLPGVFWCNYFGAPYVAFLGEEKLKSFDWYQQIELENGAVVTYLAEVPNKELLDNDIPETKAKIHLGEEHFGDVALYKKDHRIQQIKHVLKFN
ncbi:MAG: hypothetical protein ACRCWQ_10175 [Bacilli bacterium]